tara:strand:+ start:8231 stop:9751 length:1521 start_codon:yes stop_codon:yes gene_type:complete
MINVSGQTFTANDMKDALTCAVKIKVSHEVKKKVEQSNKTLCELLKKGEKFYGVNTGFGALSQITIDSQDQKLLQLNLVRSHCAGVGKPFDASIVRLTMLLKIINLCMGYSGVSWNVVDKLCSFLNHDILPIVPSKGSVGASGDLAPLSHIALALIGEGDVCYQNNVGSSKKVMKELKIEPLTLGPKEGISLINGTQVSTALAVKAVIELEHVLKVADAAGAMSNEVCLFSRNVFTSDIHKLKKHGGQRDSAKNIWKLLKDSEIVASHLDCDEVQDPYSFRCIPQVHGASREIFSSMRNIIENEVNSLSDNPVVFPKKSKIKSTGHFHGEIVGLAMDSLSIAASEIGAVSERRIARMMEGVNNAIPKFFATNPGKESGYMLAQVTAAALASENKTLAFPASVDSIPTSAGQEDFVAMSSWAGRKLLNIIDNVKSILAIEFLIAARGYEFHNPLKSGAGTKVIINVINKVLKKKENDHVLTDDINQVISLINSENFKKTIVSKLNLL